MFLRANFGIAFFVIATVLLSGLSAEEVVDGSVSAKFSEFKQQFGRRYRSAEEETVRFGYFVENMKKADGFNKRNPHAKFGVNNFSDYSSAEFKIFHNLKRDKARVAEKMELMPKSNRPVDASATSVDWRTKGAVTYVKNQGQCGSCWAFSTTGNIEGQWFLSGNSLTSLSEQELVSCDTNDDGCDGGDPSSAYQWLIDYQGGKIATETSDPYESGGGSSPGCYGYGDAGATIISYEALLGDESYMASWCAQNGPISICIDASSFQSYMGGIMTDCEAFSVDHCVLIAGFDATNIIPYWIIKNSWGSSWGEEGYARVQMYTNQCDLTSEPSSATTSSGPRPPTPPGPGPNPPPGPSRTYTQTQCVDKDCSFLCSESTHPLDSCQVPCPGDLLGSMKVRKVKDTVVMTMYKDLLCVNDVWRVKNYSVGKCYPTLDDIGYSSFS